MSYPKANLHPKRRGSSKRDGGQTGEPGPRPAGSMRLAKFIGSAGIASRRHGEEMIRAGKFLVNGKVILDPAFPVALLDQVEYDGHTIKLPSAEDLFVVALHKPVGVLSTMSPGKEKGYCIADLVDSGSRLHPVGRLDRDSSGLILLTNDGALTLHLTHPSHEIEKEYLVKLNRPLSGRDIEKIRKGVEIDGRVVKVRALMPDRGGRLRIAIHEGRNRIVRRLFGALHCNVLELKRIRIGAIGLGTLPVGRWRKLNPKEYSSLKGE